MRRPWSSKIASPSRWSSKARLYWKPEQPPPRTPTRSPALVTSAPWDSRNSRTFSAPFSLKVTPLALYVTVVPLISVVTIQRIAIPSTTRDAHSRRDQAAHRSGPAAGLRRRGGLDRRRGPLPRDRRLARVRGTEPHRAASPGLRRLRRGDRWAHPRAVPHHASTGAGMS